MSKRNLTLLIIFLIAIVAVVFIYLSVYKPASQEGEATGTNFLSNLLPFAKKKTTENQGTNPANISGYVPEAPAEVPKENLKKVSSVPVAGFTVFLKQRFSEVPVVSPADNSIAYPSTNLEKIKLVAPPTEFAPALRYVDRITGNIFQTFADKIDERQFTTTVIPKVHDAYFGNNGQSVAMRYLNDDGAVETFIGALPQETLGADTTNNTIKGSFLPENITNINFSPDTKRLFYLFNIGENESSAGITANATGDKKVQIFNSPFTEWNSWWPNSRMITLTTKPSTNVPGYLYAVDPDKKTLSKILGGINGLTTLMSPSGKLVLYSDGNLSLSVYDTDKKQANSVGLKTLPEKCVWNKTSDVVYCAIPTYIDGVGYPDVWYQGEVSFSDQIWKIDPVNQTTALVYDPGNQGEDIDGIKLALDDSENYLFLINKKDSYLWELLLK